MSVWLFFKMLFFASKKQVILKGKYMKKGKTTVASLLIVLVTLGLDQWTKWAIEKSIALNDSVEMINHFFLFDICSKIQGQVLVCLRELEWVSLPHLPLLP